MKGSLARLTSLERRFVIGALVVFIIVLNVLFIWPRFKDWNASKVRLAKAGKTLAMFQGEISQKPKYDAMVKELEGESAPVPPEDQGIDFLQTIQSQAAQSRVSIQNYGRQTESTNQIFVEKAQSITVQATEQPLVDFLYNLGSGTSLIRVRGLSLRPDAPRQQLSGNITLVASYQKKPVTRSAAPANTAASAKPATKK